ncbi:MAG: AraC family transcriptional regulator [Fimbriimonadaceae bacterium]|nr:AraC family transcriptional regulator [Fimbriimonadaceae bacterium]QYK56867.1 MAG: AraC family transcriptional regulator [Fimbriimonadaceae bacterium]
MRKSTVAEYEARVREAIRFVLERLDQPPSPAEVADKAGFSRHHFGRVFSGAVGESIAEFVRRLRLERAAHRLEHTDQSVSEIALDAGYDSLEAFSRAFRSAYLMAPTDYRRSPSRHELRAHSQVHWWPDGRRSAAALTITQETTMEATIKTIEPMRCIALRHTGPYHLIGSKFGALFEWAGPAGVPVETVLGVFHDDPGSVPAGELRSDACIAVPPGYTLPDDTPVGVTMLEIAGGDYAVATHMGSYEGLSDAWARFAGQAVPATGREPAPSASFEVYVNDCTKVPLEEVRTDLYMPLAPVGAEV